MELGEEETPPPLFMRKLSKIFQFAGFFGMLVGLGTTCTVLWYSTIIYFVGFGLFLLATRYDSA